MEELVNYLIEDMKKVITELIDWLTFPGPGKLVIINALPFASFR